MQILDARELKAVGIRVASANHWNRTLAAYTYCLSGEGAVARLGVGL